jgi:glucan phosphoethanolaminetransferase (alkaline phosphatase superfamily)
MMPIVQTNKIGGWLRAHPSWSLGGLWVVTVVIPDLLVRVHGARPGYLVAMVGSALLWATLVAGLVLLRGRWPRLAGAASLVGAALLATAQAGALGYFRFFKKDVLALEWQFVLENPRWALLLAGDSLSVTGAVALLVWPLLLAALLHLLTAPLARPARRPLPVMLAMGLALVGCGAITWYARPLTAELIGLRAMAIGTISHVTKGEAQTLPSPRRAPQAARTPARSPDVIVFVQESVGRREAFGLRQMPRTLDFLARHADRAVAMQRASSSATATTVSLPTIFSGLEPRAPRDEFARAPLLWHSARANGYATALFSAQEFSIDFFGQYFLGEDRPDVARTAPDYVQPARRVNELGVDDRLATDAALAYLKKAPSDRPYFMVVHFNATHWPCWTPEIGAGQWRSSAGEDQGEQLDPARCEAATRFIDQQMARVLDAVEGAGRMDRTFVVATSDHGEVFRPGRPSRRYSFHEETLAIPLWVHLPAGMATEAATLRANGTALVGNIDIHPTLLDLWGAPVTAAAEGAPPLTGRSLLRPVPADRTMVSITDSSISQEPPGFALYHRQWKWVFNADGGGALFDLAADPEELRDLVAQAPAAALQALRRQSDNRPYLVDMMQDLAPAVAALAAQTPVIVASRRTP